MDIQMDKDGESLHLQSNKKMRFMNENHLFEAMGLTVTNEDELEGLFSAEITNYLKT